MKKIFVILFLYSLPAHSQLVSFIVRNDTLFSINPSTGVESQVTKIAASPIFAIDGGSNDTYVITLSPAPSGYSTGLVIIFRANTANTGAASLNINGLGAKTIVKRVSTTLANGDIAALQFCMVVYNGTNFVLINPTVN